MDTQWLSLTEYSRKYQISISTLRRKIRAGKLPYSIQAGKYFLKDQSPISFQNSEPEKKELEKKEPEQRVAPSRVVFEKEPLDFVSTEEKETEITTQAAKSLGKNSELLGKLMESQSLLHKKLVQKETEISTQTEEIMQLNTAVALLEKENKELKDMLHQEKEMEEWLELR